ncbi:MoaD/ThiS family protein [Demequina lignilytica]|uniref:MoaD/ThiS family protein n=1 Tax=Demequina lignilytica TaxID=3051663 RepID=A0AB35MF67_9MICO|nr:MoaD/ThiS family protein [Demequina sp. SYSU T0a273]MDN4482408.1 MoaD/ThiS family protein [Demequina sp. SYSU T0a273]
MITSVGARGTVTVRFFAGAAEAAGEDQTLAEAGTVADLRAALADRYGAELERVLTQCSMMSGGGRLEEAAVIEPGATVDVLPPFAGG